MPIPTVKNEFYLSEDVTLVTESDKIDGEILDTYCTIEGRFCIAGNQRLRFVERLTDLIAEFRI